MNNMRHPEQIKALIRMRFGSLRAFESQHRLPPFSVASALRRPHNRAERAIAKALDLHAADIWPDRYDKRGRRLCPQPTQNYAPARGRRA